MTLHSALAHALERSGCSLDVLERACDEVVLFGSRACGWGSDDSDWDLLCVSSKRVTLAAPVHLVWITPGQRDGSAWRGSELGGHIAGHALWVHGAGDWRRATHVSDRAIARKARALSGDLAALESLWGELGPAFRRKHAVLVRRDLQRLALLSGGGAVPSTPQLDHAWSASPRTAELLSLARDARLGGGFLGERLAPLFAERIDPRLARAM